MASVMEFNKNRYYFHIISAATITRAFIFHQNKVSSSESFEEVQQRDTGFCIKAISNG